MPDLVLSSDPSLVLDVSDAGKLGSSDHSMLLVQVAGGLTDNATTEMVPDWAKADMDKLKEELAGIDWEEELRDKTTTDSWEFFKTKLLAAQYSCVPTKKRRVSNRPIWMKPNVLRIIRKKKRLWREYKTTKEFAQFEAYKKVEKQVKDSVRRAREILKRSWQKMLRKNRKHSGATSSQKPPIANQSGP